MTELQIKEEFERAIARENAFVTPRALRAYQRDLVLQGAFSLNSPVNGQPMAPVACHIANLGDAAHGNLGIAYRLDDDQALWILASGVKDGFPLAEAYLPLEDRTLWCLEEDRVDLHRAWKQEIRSVEANQVSWPPSVPGGECTVLVGHPNFAHHLWNELPALYACIEAVSRAGRGMPRVQVLYEPLLPLAELGDGSQIETTRVSEFAEVTGLRKGLVTRLGATQVPRSLRQHVLIALDRLVAGRSTLAADLDRLSRCSRVFWLSVRVDARTAANQDEFLQTLVLALSTEYPRAGFIFDGFSYPVDFGHGIYGQGTEGPDSLVRPEQNGSIGKEMRRREAVVTAHIDRLISELASQNVRPFVNASGRDLPEAISLAGRADYYICHTGTLQHKVAWLHNIPGTVHGNRATLWPRAAKWLSGQLEGGRPPALVRRDSVEDLESIRTANQVERNRDYRFLDIPSAVADVLEDIAETLSGDG